jgi:hypothetical protein
MLGNSDDEPDEADTKSTKPKNILHQNKKQNAIVGRALAMETTAAEVSQHLILGAMAGVIGLLHVLQDHIHHP